MNFMVASLGHFTALAIGATAMHLAALAITRQIHPLLAEKTGPGMQRGALTVLVLHNLPLLAVSLLLVGQGHSAMAMGVILGTYLCQLLVALPVAALIRPLVFNKNICTRLIPFLIIVCVCLFFFSIDAQWSRWDGGIFLLLAFIFSIIVIKPFIQDVPQPLGGTLSSPLSRIMIIIAALAALGLGTWVSTASVCQLALWWHRSPAWLGLSIFSLALALPRAAYCIRTAQSGQMAPAVGYVIQHSLLGLLLALGISGLWHPFAIFGSLHPEQTLDYWAVLMSGLILLAAVGLKSPRRLGLAKAIVLLALWAAWLGLRL